MGIFKTNFKGTPFSKYSYGVNKLSPAQIKLAIIKQHNSKMVFFLSCDGAPLKC
jgi:hypothetical protein